MRVAFTITGSKLRDDNPRPRQIHNLTIVFAFQPQLCNVASNIDNLRMLKQIIDVPMQPFLFAPMPRYPSFQTIQSAAGVNIISRGKLK
jgi:hypothetical protein